MNITDFLFESAYQIVTWVVIGLSIAAIAVFYSQQHWRLLMWAVAVLLCAIVVMIVIIADRAFFHPKDATEANTIRAGQVDPNKPLNQRGYLSIIGIQPLPPMLIVGGKAFEIITWGNEGDAPVEITGGFIQNFISLDRPSQVAIHCQRPAEGASPIIPVKVARIPRTQKYTNSDVNVFSRIQLDAVNQGKAYFGVCGQVSYMTVGQAYTLDFCSYYDPDEKAWVECKKDAITASQRARLASQNVIMAQFETGKIIVVNVDFSNSSELPAEDAQTFAVVWSEPRSKPDRPCPEPPPRPSSLPFQSKGTIGKGLGITIPAVTEKPMTKDQLDGILNGDYWLYVWAIAEYKSNGSGYYTRVYARLDPTIRGFVKCDKYNDAN